MENGLKIIDKRELLGKQFKIYGDLENPLFLVEDVAEWIEHSDVSTLLKGIDEEEKLIQILFVSGQYRDIWFLTEDGLYEVLMLSRKPIAKEFKKRVKMILKDIRKSKFNLTYQIIDKLVKKLDNISESYYDEFETYKYKISELEEKNKKLVSEIRYLYSIVLDNNIVLDI